MVDVNPLPQIHIFVDADDFGFLRGGIVKLSKLIWFATDGSNEILLCMGHNERGEVWYEKKLDHPPANNDDLVCNSQ